MNKYNGKWDDVAYYNAQAEFLKDHMSDIVEDILNKKDMLFSKVYETFDYDCGARYSLANYIIKDGKKFWYRIYVNLDADSIAQKGE